MNKSGGESILLLGLLTMSLALVADSLFSGFAIGVITLLVTLTTFLCVKGLPRRTSPALRQTILLIVAALAAAMCDLLLRAFFAMQINATIEPWLPLTAITSVLLLAPLKPTDKGSTSPTRIIYLLGFALIPPLVVGAARELTGFLFILLPTGILVSIALLIAAKNNWFPPRQHPEPVTGSPRTRRVRVTGPVS